MGAVEFWSHLIDAAAWPLTVVAGLALFRAKIGGWVERILAKDSGQIKAGPASASWNLSPAAESADVLLRKPDDGELSGTEKTTAEASGSAPLEITASATAVGTAGDTPVPDDQDRRKAIESLIAAGARWGWDQAESGAYSSFPTPIIGWDEHERPHVEAAFILNAGDSVIRRRPDGTISSQTIRDIMKPGALIRRPPPPS